MNADKDTIDIQREVAVAVAEEWEGFARRHPRLAAAIPRARAATNIATDLARDPDFLLAMDAADDAAAKVRLARDFARRILRRQGRRLARWF